MNAIRRSHLALAALAAVTVAGPLAACSDDNAAVTRATTPPGWAETRPVTVTGERLPDHNDKIATDAAIGLAAPALVGKSFDGTPISITPGGTPLMIVFVAHWCPHCNSEIPVLRQWVAAGLVPQGLRVVGVSTGVDKGAAHFPPSDWITKIGFPWPTMADGPGVLATAVPTTLAGATTAAPATTVAAKSTPFAAARAYGLTTYPYFVVVGADGKVKLRSSGEIPVDKLTAMVNNAINS